MQLSAARKAELDFRYALQIEVNPERHQCHAFALHCRGEPARLGFVHQDFANPARLVADWPALGASIVVVGSYVEVQASSQGVTDLTADTQPVVTAQMAPWSGLPVQGGEIYGRPGVLVGAWPTDDELTVTYIGWPAARFDDVRGDADGAVRTALDACGDLGERARAATRVEPVRSTPDLPNRFRTAYGPGWALVGDAGLVMDPIMAYGIGHAFCDAERLAAAALDGAADSGRTEAAMARYQHDRDAATMPAMSLTLDTASFAPLRPEQRVLLERLQGDAAQTSRFLGVLTGAVSPTGYFSGRNLLRLLGLRGMARVARARGSARRTAG